MILLNGLYVDKILTELYYNLDKFIKNPTTKNKIKKIINLVNKISNINSIYKDLPIRDIVIYDIKNYEKLLSYFTENGFLWNSREIIVMETINQCIKENNNNVVFYIDKNSGRVSWSNQGYFSSVITKQTDKYFFMTEKDFYSYWDALKCVINNNIKNNLNDYYKHYIQ